MRCGSLRGKLGMEKSMAKNTTGSTIRVKIVDEEITPKEYYKEAWHGRDFELEHLWQRSIFLGAFMLAIAAGYGAIVLKMLFPDTSCCFPKNVDVTARQHIAAALICYLGIAFSLLWIMMAKGSKYWFEQYEETIFWLKDEISPKAERVKILPKGEPVPPKRRSRNIFSSEAYRFSPTRINVAIGIVCLLAWSGLNMVHAGMAFRDVCFYDSPLCNLRCALFGIGQCFIGVAIIYTVLFCICHSAGD